MCGIVGLLNLDHSPVSLNTLREMTDILSHRGPDDAGRYYDGPVGLGHRRLSIIDLSDAGKQPMANEKGDLMIAYNGEVYNFQELRGELKAAGHKFRSKTDTEVIVHAYEQWGEKCLDRFNGMFAFGIWDAKKKKFFLARDRYGIKPLYYWFDDKVFIFASEIKAILQHPAVKASVNPYALLEYFTFQNIFTDRTLFQNIKLLPPGHSASVDLSQKTFKQTQYWDYNFREPARAKDMREYEEEMHRLFEQAVKRQMISDVPVGAYLSGGMDSGAITAVAAKQIPYLTSYTGGFDLSSASGLELGFDERQKAEALSYRFKTEHYEVVMKAGDMERVMPKLIWHLEDLRVGQSYPNYYVSRLASKFVKVVLAGTGGDELFAGYPWRYYRAVSNDSFEDYVQKYYKYWQRLVDNKIIQRLFQPEIWNVIKDTLTLDVFRQVMAQQADAPKTPEDYINRSLYFESRTFLHGLLLVEDKLSMAHGLETRLPFLDNDLVDFAMQLPVRAKLSRLDEAIRIDENLPGSKENVYFDKTNDGKLILRNVLGKYMPQDYVNGVKQGFSAPDATWFRGQSMEYVKTLLLDKNARIYQFLRPDTVKELLEEHLSGKQNRRLFIWSLLSFEWWLRQFIKG
jgi:asparagine synthase (glutamine-hydrolysing)